MTSFINRTSTWFGVLLVFSALFLLIGLGDTQLIDWDENIYAEASRQMMLSGDYLNIVINAEKFAEKPPFFFWEQVLSYKVFGINEFAARFPSAVAGFLMVILCYFIGTKIKSKKFGLIWAVVFLTSLLPSSIARASVIDHTFNLFIASGAFFLYLFDQRFKEYLALETQTDVSKLIYFKYLIAASICLGLAAVTKTPVGSLFSLVAFGGYKFFNRQPAIRWSHFFFCGFLSLSIALSWYVANWIISGDSFVENFIRFQLAIFSKPLQGHEGPIYYHFVAAFFGLLPWTAFLFAFKRQKIVVVNPHFQKLFAFCLSWIIFVLTLTSFVSTKLPHYSASVYIPLSLLVAMVLYQKIEDNEKIQNWIVILYGFLAVGLAVTLMFIPYLSKKALIQKGISFQVNWPDGIYVAGGIMITLGLVASILFFKNKIKMAIVFTALYMFVFSQNLWQLMVPPYLSFVQQPLLEMVAESHKKGSDVVFYRFISFAALFYGKKPIDMLYTEKFTGDPAVLNKRGQKDLYIVSDISYKKRLLKDHPLVHHIRDNGTFSYFVIAKKQ